MRNIGKIKIAFSLIAMNCLVCGNALSQTEIVTIEAKQDPTPEDLQIKVNQINDVASN